MFNESGQNVIIEGLFTGKPNAYTFKKKYIYH